MDKAINATYLIAMACNFVEKQYVSNTSALRTTLISLLPG